MSKRIENLIKDEQAKKSEINEAKAKIDKLTVDMKEMKLEKAAQINDLKRYQRQNLSRQLKIIISNFQVN